MEPSDLTRLQRELTTILGTWSAATVVSGGILALVGHRAGRKQMLRFGRNSALWGAVDGVIAAVGARAARGGERTLDEVEMEATRLRVTLLLNTVADVVYIAVGAHIAVRAKSGPPEKTSLRLGPGDGWAILMHGAFLLALDATYARRVTSAMAR